MADRGYIRSLLNGITDEATRRNLALAFDEVVDNFRIGPVDDRTRAVNGQTYFFQATTSSVASAEFTIAHGQGQTPLWLRPIVPLDAVNGQIVPLVVSRAADASRIYLKSTSTGASIFVEVGF